MPTPFSLRSERDTRPNALTLALAAERQRGASVLDLTESNPTRAGVAYESQAILAALGDPRSLTYEPEPFGLHAVRAEVAREMARGGVSVPPEHIVLTASTSEAYAFLFKLLCDPGDEVLVPAPSYPLFDLLAAFESVRLVPYRLAYDGEWHVDTDSLRRAVSPRTRAILVVSPNNPTGSYVKRSELLGMASLGLPIVSDEVFAAYPLVSDPRRALSALEAMDTLVFALGGLSKLVLLPQMKLAWIAAGGPPARVGEALERLELIADSYLSVGTPVQHATRGLLASGETARAAVQARLRENHDTLRRLVGPASAATVLKAEGGWYAVLRLPETEPEESWVLRFLQDDKVYVHPGHFFDFPEGAHVVLSLLTPPAAFEEGLRRLVTRVDTRSR